MKTFNRLFFVAFLLIPLFFASIGLAEIPPALLGTWGGQSLDRLSNGTWNTESTKITFNDNSSGTSICKSNYTGTYTESTKEFTYTVSPNNDGSFTLNISITGGETEEIKLVLSDDGTMIIVDGTEGMDSVWMEILIKLDAAKTYTNSDLSGESYKIGYEHDAQGGTKGYYRAESGISSYDGAGNLTFVAGKLNCDGTILDDSDSIVSYTVDPDGSINLDGITGFLSNNGFCSIFSNPATTDDWMNVFALKKGDKTYSTADLAGTWAFIGFGDHGSTIFHAKIGNITCDSLGNCTYSLKMRQSNGIVSYIFGSETLSVESDGSFGLSLPGGISYAGAIGNNGNTLIMNKSFAPNNLNDRDVIVAVRSACLNLAGGSTTADEEAILTNFQTGIDAYNSKNITTLMSCFSTTYLDDGINYSGQQAEFEDEFNDPDWTPTPYYTITVTINNTTATTNVIWPYGEAETMYWLKEADVWRICGNQKKYGVEAWTQNWHNGQQYMVHFQVDDPNYTATSIGITGPGINSSLTLDYYDINEGAWMSWQSTVESLDFGSTPPTPPLEYTFTIVDSSGTTIDTCTVQSFVNVSATNLSTSGAGTTANPLVFSWTGVGAGYTYSIELNDANWDRIWDSPESLTETSISYNGPDLTPNMEYHYWVIAKDQYENASFIEGSFVFQATGDINYDTAVDLTDAILALKVITGLNPAVINPGADVDGNGKIGLTEVVYILQHVAGLR